MSHLVLVRLCAHSCVATFRRKQTFKCTAAAADGQQTWSIESDSGAISENCISEFALAFDFDKLVRDLIAASWVCVCVCPSANSHAQTQTLIQ